MLAFESCTQRGEKTWAMKTLLNGSSIFLNDFRYTPSTCKWPLAVRAEEKAAEDRYIVYFIRHGALGELTTLYVCHRGLMTAFYKGK